MSTALATNKTSDVISLEEMKKRLIRYADLRGLRNAFIDTRTPGSERKENFTIIGPGVSENPEQYVHLAESHGFNIGAARQPFACVNSQHSHLTAEVFMVHSGQWLLHFGTEKQDGELAIFPGDVVSVPTKMFRGFSKVDQGVGMLYTVLGQDDPGRVTWAPSVFEMAEQYGLKLLKGGKLVDTTLGDKVPDDAQLEMPPTPSEIAELATPSVEKLLSCYCSVSNQIPNPNSQLAREGVTEAAIIGIQPTADGFEKSPIQGWWDHGFCVRGLTMETGAVIPWHKRFEEEVYIIQEGSLEVSWSGGELILTPGDTFSVPIGLVRQLRNPSSATLKAYVVRGGDNPKAPQFI